MDMSQIEFFKVELQELEPLLRKKLGDELELVNFTSDDTLLPAGEHYQSTMLKVHAIIKKSKDAEKEDLHLVAKMLPPTNFQRMLGCLLSFKKEAFMYKELIPSYQRLERDFGVKDDEIFNMIPEIYGVRCSLKDDGEVDDDAVILMQNLKVQGYKTADRQQGLDYDRTKIALQALAHFHALGIAMKHHKPEYFELIKSQSIPPDVPAFASTLFFDEPAKQFVRLLCGDPEIEIYSDFIKEAMAQKLLDTWTAIPIEPWSTITHQDFWSNNVMFHEDSESKKVVDVKLVDFQNYLFLSPLRELAFFLTSSPSVDVIENHFDELLDLYYERFIGVLTRMKVDTKPFARDKFDQRLKIDAFEEFPHCPFMLKIMCADIKAEDMLDFSKLMSDEWLNDCFRRRIRCCVKKYAEKDWIRKPN